MENKKAQGLPISTIILTILGLVILVILILGFTLGWSNISVWISPSNNVQDIVTQCDIACSLDQEYNFCSELRELKANDLGEGIKSVSQTCYIYSTDPQYSRYGISKCSKFSCAVVNPQTPPNNPTPSS